MYRILNASKTGLRAMETKINSISDDLANINTYGYKKKEIGFQELITNEIHGNDVIKSEDLGHSRINVGTKSSVATTNFVQGNLLPSSGDFHLAIDGVGFFGVYDPEGNLLLTRNGGFHLSEDNSIRDDKGNRLSMITELPVEDWGHGEVSINASGEIFKNVDGENVHLGQIILYQPEVLDSLTSLGEGGYLPSVNVELYNSLDNPERFGTLVHKYLENSNVHMGKTFTDLIVAQRAYSMNIKTLQSTDDIMSMVNNIKK